MVVDGKTSTGQEYFILAKKIVLTSVFNYLKRCTRTQRYLGTLLYKNMVEFTVYNLIRLMRRVIRSLSM